MKTELQNLSLEQLNELMRQAKTIKAGKVEKQKKVEKQQARKVEKILADAYKGLKTAFIQAGIDEANAVKVNFTIDLAGTKFKETNYKKVLRTKLIEKSKAVQMQGKSRVSCKKVGFKKGEMKLQG